MIEPCRVDISRPVTSLILSGGCWVEMADLARGNLLVRLLGGLVLKVLPELCGTKSWSHGRLYLSPQTRPNKLDTCQQNNLNFIIHVTACNPFVFLLCGKYNQISGSTVTLNYSVYPCQPIFHLLGKSHCLIPLSGPHLPPPLLLSLTLQNDPLLHYPGHIQPDNEYLTWERLTSPVGFSSTAKMRRKHHQYFSQSH